MVFSEFESEDMGGGGGSRSLDEELRTWRA